MNICPCSRKLPLTRWHESVIISNSFMWCNALSKPLVQCRLRSLVSKRLVGDGYGYYESSRVEIDDEGQVSGSILQIACPTWWVISTWWRHQMETFPRYWPSCGEFAGPRWIPRTRLVTRSFDVFFDVRINKRSKHWWGWWFETPSCLLWRQCNSFCTGQNLKIYDCNNVPCLNANVLNRNDSIQWYSSFVVMH